MKRVAIIGGGISGLAAAYELELARKRGAEIDWHLYEASDRLGGIIQTTRLQTPEGEYILEGGPDGWVSEKPWARGLAIELGLEDELIYSNDATRKTYILRDGTLEAIPDRMRMMVPEDLSALDNSPLFSSKAKAAYAAEPGRAAELKATAPNHDESVASFVRRHFGDEVLDTLAAPLLSGVFGGDVSKLSVRAVMPQFVAMEREHGSLVLALQARARERGDKPHQPIFTSLRSGMGSLVEAIVAALPPGRCTVSGALSDLSCENPEWDLGFTQFTDTVDELILATPLDVTRRFLGVYSPLTDLWRASDGHFRQLTPTQASSAVLVAFTWPSEAAITFTIPQGFGFLVPPQIPPPENCHPERSEGSASALNSRCPQLLAATFVDQKFPHRAPAGARVIRAFFGSGSAEHFAGKPDEDVAAVALNQLESILGPLAVPAHTEVQRWPRSLPQYEVGHLERIAELDFQMSRISGLTLLGNSYRGIGIPDLIRDARAAAHKLVSRV